MRFPQRSELLLAVNWFGRKCPSRFNSDGRLFSKPLLVGVEFSLFLRDEALFAEIVVLHHFDFFSENNEHIIFASTNWARGTSLMLSFLWDQLHSLDCLFQNHTLLSGLSLHSFARDHSPPRRSLRSLPQTEANPHFARRYAVALVVNTYRPSHRVVHVRRTQQILERRLCCKVEGRRAGR